MRCKTLSFQDIMENMEIHRLQQDSLSEHEKQMQQQMLSVPSTAFQLMPPNNSLWQNDESNNHNNAEDPSKKLPSLMSLKIDKPQETKKNNDVVLPKALEDVLALKDKRTLELALNAQAGVAGSDSQISDQTFPQFDVESDDDHDSNVAKPILQETETRNTKMKRKKKRKKHQKNNELKSNTTLKESNEDDLKQNSIEANINIEYIPEKITIADLAPMYRQFYRVFEIFKLENKPKQSDNINEIAEDLANLSKQANERNLDDDEEDFLEEKIIDKEKLSKRKHKKLTRLSVAELKQLVNRPDVVEMHDVTARDPKLLVQLKAHRNTVQVPRHWCFKRKYLQGKRGIEKPPFDLPTFIKKTGIMEMRASLQEKDESKTLKAKMRERARPKMGKIDIDYQKLHDAFFK